MYSASSCDTQASTKGNSLPQPPKIFFFHVRHFPSHHFGIVTARDALISISTHFLIPPSFPVPPREPASLPTESTLCKNYIRVAGEVEEGEGTQGAEGITGACCIHSQYEKFCISIEKRRSDDVCDCVIPRILQTTFSLRDVRFNFFQPL